MRERKIVTFQIPRAETLNQAREAVKGKRPAGGPFLEKVQKRDPVALTHVLGVGRRYFLFGDVETVTRWSQNKKTSHGTVSCISFSNDGKLLFGMVPMQDQWNPETDRAIAYGKIKSRRALQGRWGS